MIRTSVALDADQVNIINEITKGRNRSFFVRTCINSYLKNAPGLEKFRAIADEMERVDNMRGMVEKETVFRNAFKCIRRSGMFVDQVRERIEREYPKGVLTDEKQALDIILDKREEISKELVRFFPKEKHEKAGV